MVDWAVVKVEKFAVVTIPKQKLIASLRDLCMGLGRFRLSVAIKYISKVFSS